MCGDLQIDMQYLSVKQPRSAIQGHMYQQQQTAYLSSSLMIARVMRVEKSDYYGNPSGSTFLLYFGIMLDNFTH